MPVHQSAVAGVPWFRDEDYELLLEVIEDGFRLPIRYDTWRAEAAENYAALIDAGAMPIKTYVDPVTFLSWCEERRLPATTDSVAAYAEEVAFAAAATKH